MDKVVFEKESHTYRLGGRIIPSVTTIMRPLSDAVYGKISPKVLAKKAEKGTAIHQAIDHYILFNVFDPEYEHEIRQFIKFLEDKKFSVAMSEIVMCDGQYAGTADMILKDQKGRLHLYDLKTTTVIHRELVAVQLAGYKLLAQNEGIEIYQCGVLWLRPGKEYASAPIAPKIRVWRKLLNEYTNKVNEH